MVRINLNENVKVIFTPHGEDLLAHSEQGHCITNKNPCLREVTLPLWAFMAICGPHLFNGSKQVIEQNTLVIGDGNEHV